MQHAKIIASDVAPDAGDRRAGADRVAIGLSSTVRTQDRIPRDVVVENLSTTGFLIESPERLSVGTMLHVGLSGGGAAQARVVRRERDSYGCEFVRPLSADEWRSAFASSTVLTANFAGRNLTVIPYREAKWPGSVRLGVLVTGGAVCWAAVFQIGTALFR